MSVDAAVTSRLTCHACGHEVAAQEPFPFVCPNSGRDAGDHLLTRQLEVVRGTDTKEAAAQLELIDKDSLHPFVRYRRLLHVYHAALARGVSDSRFVETVERLDDAVASVGGACFRQTPCARQTALEATLNAPDLQLWVKDETGNVAGSHKARHLFGILIHLELLGSASATSTPLAISSCGNAGLAAATLAAAAGRKLLVFVPEWGHPGTIAQLRDLGAEVTLCERSDGEVGDPCYHAYRRAIDDGALPFCCQGNENALTIDGGRTLAYEMAEQLPSAPDRFFAQVGGGAFASASAQGWGDAVQLGLVDRLPRLHAVQAEGLAPLSRAYERVVAAGGAAALSEAARNRHEFMWPWEEEPHSLASGILDDETYDWWEIVSAMLDSGGEPIVCSEGVIREAWETARRETEIAVCPTGSVGWAGALDLARRNAAGRNETWVVVFTGVER